MATRAKEATAKADTNTNSRPFRLSEAPQIRTALALIEKHEQIFYALEQKAITPKDAEQRGQALKGILSVEKLGLQYMSLLAKMGRKAAVPRTPLLRNLLGLGERVSPTDGETVRALLPDAE